MLLILGAFHTGLFSQQTGSIKGRVIDVQVNEPLSGATVTLKGTSNSTITSEEGYFSLQNINSGKIIIVISYVGYETIEQIVTVPVGNIIVPDIAMNAFFKAGDDVVVSASKRPEKITDAPASIQVISKKELEQFTGSNTYELLSKVQGVEFTRTSIDHIAINARGLNNAFNNKVFQMVDGRNSMTTLSGNLAMHNNFSLVKDDIERIEVVLGPQTALYGPNAHNGIINFITKDPRTSQGTTVAISAGNHYQFSGRVRQATKINNKWAYKLGGEYVVGKDFEFFDSVYAGGTVYGPLVAIPEKNIDFNFRHIRGEAHVYYGVTPKADIIISAGGSNNNSIGTHTGGRLQFKNITNSFLQARYISPHFFINVYNAWGNFGNSIQVGNYTRDYWNRTHSSITDLSDPRHRLTPEFAEIFATRYGNRVKESPQRFNAEAQYNHKFEKKGLFLVAGLSYQKDMPRAYGITLVDSLQRIYIRQAGVVLQLEKSLPWDLGFVGALRWDNHSNFGNFISPKLGLVKHFGNGNIRITWGRAYSMPSVLFQYANTGGLFYGNGEGIKYIPNLSRFSDPASPKITAPLKPEEINTWEFGYKGTIAKKIYVDFNFYYGLSKNFFSPSVAVGGRTISLGDRPVHHNPFFAGQVVNDTLKNASFLTVFNFGTVKVYGIDAGITFTVNKFISFAFKYSWLGSDITKGSADNDANKDGFVSLDEKSLNSPKNRAVAILSFQNLCRQKLLVNVSARYVQQYEFYSGNQISTKTGGGNRGVVKGPNGISYLKNFDWGALGGFTSIDLSSGYKINSMLSAGVNITNLFNTDQREFAGSPLIRRLIMCELKVRVPNTK